jgi:hypothetical protein
MSGEISENVVHRVGEVTTLVWAPSNDSIPEIPVALQNSFIGTVISLIIFLFVI